MVELFGNSAPKACPKCYKQAEAAARFCSWCGCQFLTQTNTSQESHPSVPSAQSSCADANGNSDQNHLTAISKTPSHVETEMESNRSDDDSEGPDSSFVKVELNVSEAASQASAEGKDNDSANKKRSAEDVNNPEPVKRLSSGLGFRDIFKSDTHYDGMNDVDMIDSVSTEAEQNKEQSGIEQEESGRASVKQTEAGGTISVDQDATLKNSNEHSSRPESGRNKVKADAGKEDPPPYRPSEDSNAASSTPSKAGSTSARKAPGGNRDASQDRRQKNAPTTNSGSDASSASAQTRVQTDTTAARGKNKYSITEPDLRALSKGVMH